MVVTGHMQTRRLARRELNGQTAPSMYTRSGLKKKLFCAFAGPPGCGGQSPSYSLTGMTGLLLEMHDAFAYEHAMSCCNVVEICAVNIALLLTIIGPE